MSIKNNTQTTFSIFMVLSLILSSSFTTSAQIKWTKYAGNPVLTKADSLFAWDMFVVGDPSIIYARHIDSYPNCSN